MNHYFLNQIISKLKKLNNLRKHKLLKPLNSLAIIWILCIFLPFSFKLMQLKLYWKIKEVHLGQIWKSLLSVITRMC